jgi:hypothetical protein
LRDIVAICQASGIAMCLWLLAYNPCPTWRPRRPKYPALRTCALGNALFAAPLGNAGLTPEPFKDDPDPLLRQVDGRVTKRKCAGPTSLISSKNIPDREQQFPDLFAREFALRHCTRCKN